MKKRYKGALLGAFAAAALTASAFLQLRLASIEPERSIDDPLFISSPSVVKRLSLGYSGLLADVYWTRVVQYFGTKHYFRAHRYDLLAPLLDITTTLDPHLLVAYEYGSTFLAQAPPQGAGQPTLAVKLVRRGIEENPNAWRLYNQLGFLEYLELHDAKAAAAAFEEGSRVPGAHPFMRVMAAKLATDAGDPSTAIMLWTQIYQSTEDPALKQNALLHLVALKVDRDVEQLQQLMGVYEQRYKAVPSSMMDLVRAGLLRAIPQDPLGRPYKIGDGRIEVSDPDDLPFVTRGLPPGHETVQVPPPSAAAKDINPEELFSSRPSNQ